MFHDVRTRMIAIIIFLCILVGMFIWYGSLSPEPNFNHYPGDKEIINDYDSYTGEMVEVGGKVTSVSPLTIEVKYGTETMELVVTGVEEETSKGDRMTVFGTLQEDDTVIASRVVIRPYINFVYMYVVSFIAAFWLLYRIVSQWRWNRTKKAFEPRERPLKIKEVMSKFKEVISHG